MELSVPQFFKKCYLIGRGSFAVISSDKLNADMTALDASTLTISGNYTLQLGISCVSKTVDDEWLVTSIASAPTYAVTVIRSAAYGVDANPAWKNGATVVNTSFQGRTFI